MREVISAIEAGSVFSRLRARFSFVRCCAASGAASSCSAVTLLPARSNDRRPVNPARLAGRFCDPSPSCLWPQHWVHDQTDPRNRYQARG